MTKLGAGQLSSTILLFVIGSLATSALAQENSSNGKEQIDLKDVWKKVLEVNQVWLDPRPESLSYKIVSGSPPLADPETTQFVWISGNKARWEMESRHELNPLNYTLIMTPDRSQYLRGPESLLGRNIGRQPLGTLRQSFAWHSAIHALQQQGLPDDAKVISDLRDGDSRLIAIQATPANERSFVGLGLYHVFYGSSQWPIGQIKLTLKLPEYVPFREEFADGARIEFESPYLKVGNHLAPKSMRYISKSGRLDPWILAAEFQIVDGVWLLKSAQNIQNQKIVKQMNVQDVSTRPIADEKFAIPEKHQ
ncbi:MAG: hypothetical protein JSS49_19700 [Planctomycetes bacterium]|nr:hypothetical protein [Planctomycetota bacterium]